MLKCFSDSDFVLLTIDLIFKYQGYIDILGTEISHLCKALWMHLRL